MKTIIALSGLPGSGKTTLKNADPVLKGLPFVDVAVIYAELDPIDSPDAFAELLRQASEVLEGVDCLIGSDAVVIEATLARGSWQRPILEGYCKVKGIHLDYIELMVDPEECYRRVMAQYNEVYLKAESDDERSRLERYYRSRIDIIRRDIQPR